jgi:acyl carrier protein
MTNLQKLKSAFATALNLPQGANVERSAYGETAEWDSVAHMALIAEIEGTFDIMLDTDEVIEMSSFLRAAEIVTNHGVSVRVE